MVIKNRQQAIHWTNLFIQSLTPEDAKSISCGLIGAFSLEGINRWLWAQGIGGWYYDVCKSTFCNEVARIAVIEKTVEFFKNSK